MTEFILDSLNSEIIALLIHNEISWSPQLS